MNTFEYFAGLGVLSAVYVFLKFASKLSSFVLVYGLKSGLNVKRLGKWAVITGGTDGIGKEYARELARRGMDVILLSRSRDKLNNVSAEIKNNFNVETKVIEIDFSDSPEMYDMVRKELSGLDIGILVNNVGVFYKSPEYFDQLTSDKLILYCDQYILSQEVQDMININNTAMTMMTRIVLPGMLERKRGAVVNISSGLAMSPAPLHTLYSATKIYVDFFTRSLQVEYKGKGIIIQNLMPFQVSTNMSKQPVSFFVPSPQDYASSAVNTLGVTDETNGYFAHALEAFLINLIPDFVKNRMILPAMLRLKRKMEKQNKIHSA